MEKFFYLTVILGLGMYSLHAQDLQKSEDTDRDTSLVEKNRSDTSTEAYALLKRKAAIMIEPRWHLTEAIGKYMGQCPPTERLSNPSLSEMTVYEPKGDYKMRLFEVDSTKQFHLRIYKDL